MLFRSCAARCLCAVDVGAAVGDIHNPFGQRVWLFPSAARAANLFVAHPQFEGFEVRQAVGRGMTLAPRGASFGNARLMSVIGGDPDLTRTYHFVTD
jgi:hypothetical protein